MSPQEASTEPKKPIRVRMAPSPTGPLHIGTARATLFNLLFARHTGGTFILRIEDTDKERSKTEHEIGLIEGLHWLGIFWDEGPEIENGKVVSKGEYGPYRDTERVESHKNYIRKFLEEGKAYQCYCTKEKLDEQRTKSESRGVPFRYPRTCRDLTAPPAGATPQTVRLRMPDEDISFDDLIRGTVVVKASELDDFAIARSDGSPLYNFAVAIDDYEMKISHVIRGEDHISNTPKQIGIYQALGAEPPLFAHAPLILNPDRSKMSKRFSDTALADYRAKGYLPAAIVNFLALLGWHPKDDQEIFSLDELGAAFEIERVQKGGAIFNQDKLDWLNKEYLKKMSDEEIAKLVEPMFEAEQTGSTGPDRSLHPYMQRTWIPASARMTEKRDTETAEGRQDDSHATILKIVAVERTRATTLRDFVDNGKLFFTVPEYEADLLVWKNMERSAVAPALQLGHDMLAAMSDNEFTAETIKAHLDELAKDRPKGEIYWPLRVALSGLASSPDPASIAGVIGKEESLKRIESALEKLKT